MSEIRLLNNEDALLFIRGEKPIRDKKYNVMTHDNISYTTMGGAEPYKYGIDDCSVASLSFELSSYDKQDEEDKISYEKLEIYTEDEMEEFFNGVDVIKTYDNIIEINPEILAKNVHCSM